jgi:alpha-L-fucosidase
MSNLRKISLSLIMAFSLVNLSGATLSKSMASNEASRDTSLAKRLEWFQDMKFGLFIHFGIYSQWGCVESWPVVEDDTWARTDDVKAWTDRNKDFSLFKRDYWQLNKTFNPTKFNPEKWADAAKYAGMKYFVFTTKHHDGFSMYDTHQTDFKITDPSCPFHTNKRKDITKEAFTAFRKKGFGIGAYYSKADWHSPYYWLPDSSGHGRRANYNTLKQPVPWAKFQSFVYKQVEELTTGYGAIDILWLDAAWTRAPHEDIHMDDIAAMARKNQPGLIMVDRNVHGKNENYRTPEQEVPAKPLEFVWETCMTMGDQWSYKPEDKYKSTFQLVQLLVDIVAKGGNFLLNIGPDSHGELPAGSLSRLHEMGDWMSVNQDGIYGTRPIAPYKEGNIAFTSKQNFVYAYYLAAKEETKLPAEIRIKSLHPMAGTKVYMLGYKKPLDWSLKNNEVVIQVPADLQKLPPCKIAWCVKFQQVQ